MGPGNENMEPNCATWNLTVLLQHTKHGTAITQHEIAQENGALFWDTFK